MASETAPSDVARMVRKWRGKRGALVMMLHEIQNTWGYVPRNVAIQLAQEVDVPLARIYEVITFYNYFKLKAPGEVVISVCTGTACHLKGADQVMAAFEEELGIQEGQSTPDGRFHLQSVRCVGCCGLAPAVVINGQMHGKVQPAQVKGLVAQWQTAAVQKSNAPSKTDDQPKEE